MRRRGPFQFPDPAKAPRRGLVAVGGDLSVERLLEAYDAGIFPWYSGGEPVHWWSPDPRAVMDVQHLHVSSSLSRVLRRERFRVTWDHAFRQVMENCAAGRRDGTWITRDMLEAYCELHRLGHARSIEVWQGGTLAGGLYGVKRGAAFMAESMFHTVADTSKVALVAALRTLFGAGARLFDVQFLTPHLASMGAYTISRGEYLRRLTAAVGRDAKSFGFQASRRGEGH